MSASRIWRYFLSFGALFCWASANVAASDGQPFTEQDHKTALDFFSDGGVWSFALDQPERAEGEKPPVLVLLDRKERSKIKELTLGSAESGGKNSLESALKVLDLYSRPRATLAAFIRKFAEGVERGDYAALLIKTPRFSGEKLLADGAVELTKDQLLALFRDVEERPTANQAAPPAQDAVTAGGTTLEPLRIWVDKTGKYRTEARLVEFKNDQVRLQKKDGKIATIPLDRLSEKDRQYLLAKSKRTPGPPGASAAKSQDDAPGESALAADAEAGNAWANVDTVEMGGRAVTPGDQFQIRPAKDVPLDSVNTNPRFELNWQAGKSARGAETENVCLTVILKGAKSKFELTERAGLPKRGKKGKVAKSFTLPLSGAQDEVYVFFSKGELDEQNRLQTTVVSNILRIEVK